VAEAADADGRGRRRIVERAGCVREDRHAPGALGAGVGRDADQGAQLIDRGRRRREEQLVRVDLRGEVDAELHLRDPEPLGRDHGGELAALANDHVGAPLRHRRHHAEQGSAGLEADEQLADHVFGARGGGS
jgi:hypothetical protein